MVPDSVVAGDCPACHSPNILSRRSEAVAVYYPSGWDYARMSRLCPCLRVMETNCFGMRKSEAVAAGDSGVPFTERAEPHTVAQCTVLV